MSRNRIALAGLGLLVLVISVRIWFGLRTQPQLPPSDEAFSTVDALFTAVTARDEQRLAACAKRLGTLASTGDLPPPAQKRLNEVIATARAGKWELAAQRLYAFMQNQRRDGAVSQHRGQTAMKFKSAH